jgi:hypothetical protein
MRNGEELGAAEQLAPIIHGVAGWGCGWVSDVVLVGSGGEAVGACGDCRDLGSVVTGQDALK